MATSISTVLGGRPQAGSSHWRALTPSRRPLQSSRRAAPIECKPPQPVHTPAALPNDISSRFGRRLREMRHSRALTQADMARRFGIDRSFISEIECGRKAISLPMIEVIALGLQISLSELLQGI